ncbi:cytochrome P450 monooxygenase [Xylaria venustula]|nr:cytochrome P450 monooxygenase [Xylaria venustula]
MSHLISSIILAVVSATFVRLALSAAANRRHMRKLQAAGHLIALKEYAQVLPRNATIHVVIQHMAKEFPNGIFYLNLWPFNKTMIVVANPVAAAQVEAAFLDKPSAMCDTLEVINGGPSLMTMHGDTWKRWRGLLNPGFAAGYMTGLAPAIAQEVAKGEMSQLEEYTLRLTFDVISRITFDARLHYQTQGSALADCLHRQVYWTSFGTSFNPIRRYLSIRPLVQNYLVVARQSQIKAGSGASSRSIISLAMDKYLEEVGSEGDLSKKAFKKLAKPQLRMFLYAGHDTTSSTLLYCILLLSEHPEVLSKLLLRLFPPAGSLRDGRPDFFLVDEDGKQYPTNECHIWTLSLAMHHHPSVFSKPEHFIPERWLADASDPLHPTKGSWRAFEWGQRNCIGQTLAQMELKVALVMTMRTFDITPAYAEWDGHTKLRWAVAGPILPMDFLSE